MVDRHSSANGAAVLRFACFVACLVLLSFQDGDAGTTASSAGSGIHSGTGTIPAPHSGSAQMVDASVAVAHITRLRNYLWSRLKNNTLFVADADMLARLRALGVNDGDRAYLLKALTPLGVRRQMLYDFYGTNQAPLDKVLLRFRSGTGPSHIPRAELDELDRQMRLLLQVEPKVRKLLDSAAALDAQEAALYVREQRIQERNRLAIFAFSVGTNSSYRAKTNSDANFRSYQSGFQELQALGAQISAVSQQERDLLKQYQSLQTHFITELGTRNDIGITPNAPSSFEDHIPPDAVPD
jgi:hypothetical protein